MEIHFFIFSYLQCSGGLLCKLAVWEIVSGKFCCLNLCLIDGGDGDSALSKRVINATIYAVNGF